MTFWHSAVTSAAKWTGLNSSIIAQHIALDADHRVQWYRQTRMLVTTLLLILSPRVERLASHNKKPRFGIFPTLRFCVVICKEAHKIVPDNLFQVQRLFLEYKGTTYALSYWKSNKWKTQKNQKIGHFRFRPIIGLSVISDYHYKIPKLVSLL